MANNNNGEKKLDTRLAFWGPYSSGRGGEFYSSPTLDTKMYDQLMKELEKLEVGSRFYINVVESDNEKAPSLKLSVRSAAEVATGAKPRQSDDI